MDIKQKRCRYCKDWFIPEPNIKKPVACGKARCRKARKSEAGARWREKNPNHDKGRYPNTKRWLEKHPGYQPAYRESHPENLRYNRIMQRQRRARKKR